VRSNNIFGVLALELGRTWLYLPREPHTAWVDAAAMEEGMLMIDGLVSPDQGVPSREVHVTFNYRNARDDR
jgi:hypothetical protein